MGSNLVADMRTPVTVRRASYLYFHLYSSSSPDAART